MSTSRPWFRTNRQLVLVLPFLVIALAVTRAAMAGTARTVAQAVLGVALLGFIVLVGVNARADAR